MKFTSGPLNGGQPGGGQSGPGQGGFRVSYSLSSNIKPARDGQADARRLQAVGEAAQAGDMDRAIVLAEAALAEGQEHPMLLSLSALRLERENRLPEALIRLHRAREIAPRDIGALNALGLCLHRLERPGEALEVFDALLAVNPNLPFAHANRGMALQASGRLDRAEEAFRRALSLAPGHPIALGGLAAIASRKGDHVQARDLALQVLKIEPNLPDPTMSLARAEVALGDAAGAEARLRALLSDPRPTAVERADAWNLIGDILDARGDATAAFEAYRTCNDLLRETYAERFTTNLSAADFARGMTRWFAANNASAWRSRPTAESNPYAPASHVFLVGFPRSGTTLLEVALAGSPDVVTLEEQEALAEGVRRFLREPSDLAALARASEADLDAVRAAYWKDVRAAGCEPAGKVFIDRYPLNTLKLPLIARLFPDAKILFAVRDPRDVVWSCYRRRFQMSSPMYQFLTLEGAAAFYDAAFAMKAKLDEALSLDQRVVRHEDLLADFEGEMRAICGFIGVEWREAMRDVAARTADRAIATPSTAQLARGLNSDGAGAWRRYAGPMAPALPILAPWVERLGYGA